MRRESIWRGASSLSPPPRRSRLRRLRERSTLAGRRRRDRRRGHSLVLSSAASLFLLRARLACPRLSGVVMYLRKRSFRQPRRACGLLFFRDLSSRATCVRRNFSMSHVEIAS